MEGTFAAATIRFSLDGGALNWPAAGGAAEEEEEEEEKERGAAAALVHALASVSVNRGDVLVQEGVESIYTKRLDRN